MASRLDIPLIGISLLSRDLMVALAALLAATLGCRWITRGEGLDARRVRWALLSIAALPLAAAWRSRDSYCGGVATSASTASSRYCSSFSTPSLAAIS